MWTARSQMVEPDRVIKVAIEQSAGAVVHGQVLTLLKSSEAFRAFFNATLADAPFEAFRWETPAVTKATADRPFEFVLLNDPHLSRQPDSQAFAEHFQRTPDSEAIAFDNLRRDATLVVPAPIDGTLHDTYVHLGAFVRDAPASQRDALWQLVGATMLARLSDKPVWLSTAGAGVAWLHVRLDDRPKYYGYGPYCER